MHKSIFLPLIHIIFCRPTVSEDDEHTFINLLREGNKQTYHPLTSIIYREYETFEWHKRVWEKQLKTEIPLYISYLLSIIFDMKKSKFWQLDILFLKTNKGLSLYLYPYE